MKRASLKSETSKSHYLCEAENELMGFPLLEERLPKLGTAMKNRNWMVLIESSRGLKI